VCRGRDGRFHLPAKPVEGRSDGSGSIGVAPAMSDPKINASSVTATSDNFAAAETRSHRPTLDLPPIWFHSSDTLLQLDFLKRRRCRQILDSDWFLADSRREQPVQGL
jgi:hypothetical protein